MKKNCPKATTVQFTARFKTYLIIDDKTNYVVNWEAITSYDVATGVTSDVDYNTGACGNANALPEDLKKILDASYAGNKIQ